MMIPLFVIWLLFSVLAYYIFMTHDKKLYGWKMRDRFGCGAVCLLLGPVAWVMALLVNVDWDKEVKW